MTTPLRMWQYRVFAATWLSYAGYYLCRKPFSNAKATLGEELGWSPDDLKWIGAAYLISYAVGQFIAGFAGNRLGPRLVLLVGMIVTLVVNFSFGLSNSLYTFAGLMIINGLAQATGWSANVAIMGNWFRREERGTVMGIWGTNYQFGGIAAGFLSAWLVGNWGWEWSFFVSSFLMLGVIAFFAFNGFESPADRGLPPLEDAAPPATVAVSASVGAATAELAPAAAPVAEDSGWTMRIFINVLVMGVFYFFIKFIRYAVLSWAPYLLEVSYGQDAALAGYISTIFDITGTAGVVIIGWISDRFYAGRRTMISFWFVVALFASCLFLYLLGPTAPLMFAISLGLIGFALYGPDSLVSGAGAIDVGTRRTAALAAGIINGMGSTGAVLQELVLGKMLNGKEAIGGIFAVLLISSFMAMLSLGVLVMRNRSGAADV